MQKIWILSELFYPDETSTSYILTKIANRLSENFEVQVMTMGKNEKSNSSYFSLDEKVNVIRFRKFSENKNNLFIRLASFFYTSIILSLHFAKNVKKDDKVLVVTNPAPLILFVSFLRSLKKFKLFVLVHDVFPENTIPAGVIKSKTDFKYKIIEKIFNRAFSGVDYIIVLGRDMRDLFERKSSSLINKIKIIENWGDIVNIFPEKKDKDSGQIVLQYAGNVGRVQGLMELLLILKQVDNPIIRFDIYGEGVLKETLRKWVNDNNVKNINFYPSYKREEQNKILNSCDLAVVSLADGMYGLGVPSKTYNILAAGKPVLYLGEKNTEVDCLIRENKIGYSFEIKDEENITKFFKNLGSQKFNEFREYGHIARNLAENKFSEDIILKKFVNLFRESKS